MLAFLNHAVGEGFLKQVHADMLHVSDTPNTLLGKLVAAPRVRVDKWIEKREET
jgi:predicted Rossmann-fold nucleotide-binding protein